MRRDDAAVRVLTLTVVMLLPGIGSAQVPPPRASASAVYDALLDGMNCRQKKTGRMDCEFRVGATRFVVSGVGQDDVLISFTQADTAADFVAGIAPLHGCVVVRPTRAADAAQSAGIPLSDSISLFAFVSPRTGRVYRTWSTCLGATRGAVRAADSSASADTLKTKVPAKPPGNAVARPPL